MHSWIKCHPVAHLCQPGPRVAAVKLIHTVNDSSNRLRVAAQVIVKTLLQSTIKFGFCIGIQNFFVRLPEHKVTPPGEIWASQQSEPALLWPRLVFSIVQFIQFNCQLPHPFLQSFFNPPTIPSLLRTSGYMNISTHHNQQHSLSSVWSGKPRARCVQGFWQDLCRPAQHWLAFH